MKSIHRIFGCLALILGIGSANAFAQSPEILPSIPGNYTYPADVNNQGTIIGNTYDRDLKLSAIQWQDGVLTELAGYPSSFAAAINDEGVIVGAGYEMSDPHVPQPVMWVKGEPKPLPTLGFGGIAYDINARGEIAGWVNTERFTAPAVWRNGQLTVLPGFYEFGGEARSIDEQGRIYGFSSAMTGEQAPTEWINDVPTALPVTFGENCMGVLGVNKSRAGRTAGFLVEQEFLEDGTRYLVNVAVAWQGGQFRVLQRPSGRGNSIAFGGNEQGLLVGSTTDGEGYTTPTVWDEDGAVRLPLDPGRSAIASAANESGWIVGVDHTDGRNPIPLLWRIDTLNRIQMTSVTAAAGRSVTVQAKVTRAGSPVPNQTMEFRVNDVTLGVAKSDAQGVVRMTYRVPRSMRGKAELMASLGGSNYLFRNVVVGKTTTRSAISPGRARAGETVTFSTSLRAQDLERPLAKRAVSLVVADKVVARSTTSAQGLAKFNYRVPMQMAGRNSVPVEVRFAGDREAMASVGRASLVIKG